MWYMIVLLFIYKFTGLEERSPIRSDVPFVVQVTPRFLPGCEFQHDAPHGPDVHRTVSTTSIVFDDLWGHIHRSARQATA
jgi:hypothetical protein